jgi:hypothetical protein
MLSITEKMGSGDRRQRNYRTAVGVQIMSLRLVVSYVSPPSNYLSLLMKSGPNTLEQSALAATMDGNIARIGTRGGNQSSTATLPHTSFANTRRIVIVSRMQFEEMNRAIEVNDIHSVIDQRVFGFQEVPEAFQYLWDQKAVGR